MEINRVGTFTLGWGESLVWDERRTRLYFVDCAAQSQLGSGKVEFDDGTWRTAFGCDAAAATGTDISAYGSWPTAVAAGAAPSA